MKYSVLFNGFFIIFIISWLNALWHCSLFFVGLKHIMRYSLMENVSRRRQHWQITSVFITPPDNSCKISLWRWIFSAKPTKLCGVRRGIGDDRRESALTFALWIYKTETTNTDIIVIRYSRCHILFTDTCQRVALELYVTFNIAMEGR